MLVPMAIYFILNFNNHNGSQDKDSLYVEDHYENFRSKREVVNCNFIIQPFISTLSFKDKYWFPIQVYSAVCKYSIPNQLIFFFAPSLLLPRHINLLDPNIKFLAGQSSVKGKFILQKLLIKVCIERYEQDELVIILPLNFCINKHLCKEFGAFLFYI